MDWKRITYGAVSVVSGTLLGAFLGGAVLARLFIIEATGFDAIADALGYAMIGGGVAFFGLLYFAWQVSLPTLRRGTLLLASSALLLIGLLYWRTRQSSTTSASPTTPVAPRARTMSQPSHDVPSSASDPAPAASSFTTDEPPAVVVGYGFVRVPFSAPGIHLLFYADAAFDSPPVDSLIYTDSPTGFQLRYAPPDFMPFYLKPDYQRLFLRMTGIGPYRVEVRFNEQSDKRYWVDRGSIDLAFWPDFLSGVFSVEPLAAEDYPLRERPLDHANPLLVESDRMILLPRFVKGDWIRVMISPDGATPTKRFAWLRWRHEERLLVRWSYGL